MKKTAFITLLIFFSLESHAQYPKVALKVPTQEMLDDVPILTPRAKGIGGLPPSINLDRYLPKPESQGSQGSCAAFAACYGMLTYNKCRERKWSLKKSDGTVEYMHVFSPSFVFNSLNSDPTCQGGITIINALRMLKEYGCCPWAELPYFENTCSTPPSQSALEHALKNRILSYSKLYSQFDGDGVRRDLTRMKFALADSLPIILGIKLDISFWRNTYGNRDAKGPFIWTTYTDDLPIDSGYHAVLCVGYNDTLNAFKILNSWGTRWGNKGFGWISYEVMKKVLYEAYTTENLGHQRLLTVSAIAPLESRSYIPKGTDRDSISNVLSWMKPGYFWNYDNIKLSCLAVNTKEQSAIFRLNDIADNNREFLSFIILANETRMIEYQGKRYKFYLNKVGRVGFNPQKGSYNPLNSAAFYSFDKFISEN